MKKKNKINILMISSSSILGGGTKHMFTLGQNLSKDFKVFYAIPKNQNFEKILNPENHIEIAERKLNIFDIINLINFVNSKSIDIIHSHGKGAGLIGRILILFKRRPLIYTFHGIHLRCHNKFQKVIYIFYEFLLGRLDSEKILVSNSEKVYAQKSNIFLGNKYKIIYNGVRNLPKKSFQKLYKKNNKYLRSSNIKIISLCRFVRQKNINEILKIAKRLPKMDFYIIGNGPLWDEIKYNIKNQNIFNVYLLGEKKDILRYLYSADIYLSTSLYEGLPLSILEAMSIGLPVLASNVIGNCDTIVNGKSGFLYEIHNVNEAVNILNKLSKNKYLREEVGDLAHLRQREFFSKKIMISNYKELYKSNF